MNEDIFITIGGLDDFEGMKPFKIGSLLALKKEPDNENDNEAIAAYDPIKGRVGYVANSPDTVAKGSFSAGRLYDRMPDECAAVVRFMTDKRVIARVMPDRRIVAKIEITLQEAMPDNDITIMDIISKLFSANDDE